MFLNKAVIKQGLLLFAGYFRPQLMLGDLSYKLNILR